MTSTVIEPSFEKLRDYLNSFGYAEFHGPAPYLGFNDSPPFVSVYLILYASTECNPVDWRKQVIDQVDGMILTLRRMGWVLHGGTRIIMESAYDSPTCTLDNKLVQYGDETGIIANVEFSLLSITGEVIAEEEEATG